MVTLKPLSVVRIIISLTILLLVIAASQIIVIADENGVLFLSRRWTTLLAFTLVGAILSICVLIFSWSSFWPGITKLFQQGMNIMSRLRGGNIVLLLLAISLYCWMLLGPLGYLFENYYVRICFFWLLSLVGALLITVYLKSNDRFLQSYQDTSWIGAMIAAWIMIAFGYQLAVMLPTISNFPFSIGWSETSRYYYASLFFSKKIYGLELSPPVLHPSRYLMQSVPFLISNLPLWFHRSWQVFIWVATTLLIGYLLSRRLSLTNQRVKITLLLFMAWAYIFLFQGPVYYHLLVCVIIVLWGFNQERFWKSLFVVILASLWAGISRINWYPVPGLLAAILFFLESRFPPSDAYKSDQKIPKEMGIYLVKPILWVSVGTLIAFVTQAIYIFWSGADLGEFTTSFTSNLLWYRLLPNPTFPLGIIPALILISGPLLVIILRGLRGIHRVRQFGMGVIVLILFVGGVIVSTKVGGGSNLHNLDGYLVVLLVLGGYVYFNKVTKIDSQENQSSKRIWLLTMLVVLIPAAYLLRLGGPVSLIPRQQYEQALETLNEMTSEVVEKGEDVLFITERQLITFGILERIPLIDNYETVFLMEMAMAGNVDYLDEFHESLKNKEYALIITDQQRINYKGRDFPFGEENDICVTEVTVPILKYYQREVLFKELGIEILAPRE
jgi:hypothetical protein